VAARIERLLADQKSSEKEIERLKAVIAAHSAEGAEVDVQMIDGVKVLAKRVEADNPAALRDLADKFKDRIKSGVVVLGSAAGGKALLIAGVTHDLLDRFHAGNIVKQVAAMVGGGGGGRPDMAQAGGTQPEKLDDALSAVYHILGG
jgi:alanyl-tRNA synthetase